MITSTYRLQIRPSFTLVDAVAVIPYLASLGVGAVYLSPLLPSAAGSDHGYDVVRYDGIDEARGGREGWLALLAACREHGLGIVVDIVPNHTGVARAHENPAWWDVLANGPESEFAKWFDIDWSRGRVLLPVLGDDVENVRIEDGEVRYHEHRFPLAPTTSTLEEQYYELGDWRRADTEQNYRRFFTVTSLAGLRVEDPAVFDATHAEIVRWVRENGIDGLRIDHPDGLADPLAYLQRLRSAVAEDTWLLVEKILEPGEVLPEWPVAGTTGYDALGEVCGVFLDPAAEPALDAAYRSLTGDTLTAADHIAAGKRQVLRTILQAEVARVAALASLVPNVTEAIVELAVAFPVYRSYQPVGAEHLGTAMRTVLAARPELTDSIGSLASRLADPADELCARFQQLTGAAMAKGVEDTAWYRYNRFVALNEVGGDPGRFGVSVGEFHSAQAARSASAPEGMTTLSTHDTKRGEDVRARLAVVAELAEDWAALSSLIMEKSVTPGASGDALLHDQRFKGVAYLVLQTFAGAGFIAPERMHAYLEKAMREASDGTSWSEPNHAFEQAVHAFVDSCYSANELRAFAERITPYGWVNSLGQKLVQLTMPGVPDVYQGTEVWDDSLVDPDNRRPVDFALLAGLAPTGPPPVDASGAAKAWVTRHALHLRREHPELFASYAPVAASGRAADHVLAFDRGGAITVATRLPVALERAGGWRDTTLALDGPYTDVLTGQPASTRLADLLRAYPVALLVRA